MMSQLNKKVFIAVIHAERPGADYLPSTLEAIDSTGGHIADKKFVVCDGVRRKPCSWPRETLENGPVGARFAAMVAVLQAIEHQADLLLLFEDDLELCQNAVYAMATAPIPDDVGFASYYDPGIAPHRIGAPRLVTMPLEPFYGSLAIALPARSLQYLAAVSHTMFLKPHIGKNAWDAHLLEAFKRSPWPLFSLCVPSLVQHLGQTSIVNNLEKNRTSPSYKHDFDAATLANFRTREQTPTDEERLRFFTRLDELWASQGGPRFGFFLARQLSHYALLTMSNEDLTKALENGEPISPDR